MLTAQWVPSIPKYILQSLDILTIRQVVHNLHLPLFPVAEPRLITIISEAMQ